MFVPTTFCLLAIVAWANGECVDSLASCYRLDEMYCKAPYDVLAAQVCPKRCGLCDESNNSINKRSHNHGPEWSDHCWDQSSNHIQDPFCALLTTTTTPKPTTPTTTTVPTTTTTEPTTTTVPTTTTTEPTTTTTEPPTTTTEPTTTTTRICHYEEYNETDIKSTDFGTDIALVQNTNITLNESVHLIGDVNFCQGVCAQSLLNDGFECWAFTYNEYDRCYLYYYNRPLKVLSQDILNNGTSLFLKRCTDDPLTTKRMETTTQRPTTTEEAVATTEAPSGSTQAPSGSTQAPSGSTQAPSGSTQAPSGSTQAPSGSTQMPAGTTQPMGGATDSGAMGTTSGAPIAVNTTEIINTTQIIFGTTIINIINGTVLPINGASSGVTSGGSVMGVTTDSSANTGPPPLMTTTTASSGGGTQVGPDTSAGPGGVIIVSSNSYKVSGTRSPVPDTCFFLNQTFSKGGHWKDTCRYDCECFDIDTNTALCTDVCPHYSSIPPTCTIKTEAGQCCPQLDCGNNTEIINSTNIDQGSGNVSDCRDMQDNCDYYEDTACVGVYEPWARAHCALRCGYCDYQPPCYDRLTYCSLYELDTACVDYRGWARYNCKRSCNICT